MCGSGISFNLGIIRMELEAATEPFTIQGSSSYFSSPALCDPLGYYCDPREYLLPNSQYYAEVDG